MAGITLLLIPSCFKYSRLVLRSGKDRVLAIGAFTLFWAFLLLDLLAMTGHC
jgi:hypothetical protein